MARIHVCRISQEIALFCVKNIKKIHYMQMKFTANKTF